MARPRRVMRGGRAALTGPPPAPEPHPRAIVATLVGGTALRRIYWPDPYEVTATSFRFNGPRNRFDHHRRPGPFPAVDDDPDRGIFYAAPSFECCLVECFGDQFVVDPNGARVTVLRTTAELQVLDLRKEGAVHAGTLAAINQDGEREITQEWARYWYEHPELRELDGLLFAGAHNDEDALAIWERAAGKFDPILDAPLTDAAVLRELIVIANALDMPVVDV